MHSSELLINIHGLTIIFYCHLFNLWHCENRCNVMSSKIKAYFRCLLSLLYISLSSKLLFKYTFHNTLKKRKPSIVFSSVYKKDYVCINSLFRSIFPEKRHSSRISKKTRDYDRKAGPSYKRSFLHRIQIPPCSSELPNGRRGLWIICITSFTKE